MSNPVINFQSFHLQAHVNDKSSQKTIVLDALTKSGTSLWYFYIIWIKTECIRVLLLRVCFNQDWFNCFPLMI